jgi:HPt (histidine-containing phosphotransfer) domain-containing protein
MAPEFHLDEALMSHLDMDVMDQLLGLDDGEFGLLEEMLGLYREDTPDRITAVGVALDSGNMSEMADVAHAIKGSAGTMGAPKVRAVAALLEGGGRTGKWDTSPSELLEQLKVAYEDSLRALEGFVAANKK